MDGPELVRKLGIKAGHHLFVRRECADLLAVIRPNLPADVTVLPPRRKPVNVDVAILRPVKGDLTALFEEARSWIVPNGSVWVVVKRKPYRQGPDVSFEDAQAAALPTGLVDNKECTVSDTEYATRYVIRKELRPKT